MEEIDMKTEKLIELFDKNGNLIKDGDRIKYMKRGGIRSNDNVYTGVINFNEDKTVTIDGRQINSWNYLFNTFEIIKT